MPLIPDDLTQFTGTTTYYRHGMLRFFRFTDGIKYLADQANAYWVIDIIASYQLKRSVRAAERQVWKLKVAPDRSARISCHDDRPETILAEQRINRTDFPLTEIEMWVADQVLYLPSEH